MNKRLDDRSAFTVTELLAVLGALALLMALAVPLLGSNRANSDRMVCQSNLRLIGRAYAMWADDHGGKHPYRTGSAEGGNNDNALCNNNYFQFYWVRVELGTPRILVCPSDSEKRPTSDWSSSPTTGFISAYHRNNSSSYLLALEILQSPRGLLIGDRSILPSSPNSGGCSAGLLYAGAPSLYYDWPTLDWTEKLHNKSGNIVLNDGSVIAAGQSELRTAVQRAIPPESHSLCVLYPN